MPLPKTDPIAARATEVYCEAWSVIQQKTRKMPPTRESDLNDLSQLLPYLRQLLTCCACAGLLDNPMISLTCGHCYCYGCQFKEPLLKIQCRQCRERTGLVIESQLLIVVDLYKEMCHILGEELRRNPSVMLENENADSLPKLNVSIKLQAQDTGNEEGGVVPEKEAPVLPQKKTGVTAEDPIAEIVREVESGTKVSRAVLWIKPPLKYLNSKIATPCKTVVKKEVVPTCPTSVPPSETTLSVENDAADLSTEESNGNNLQPRNRKGRMVGKASEEAQMRTKSAASDKTRQSVSKKEPISGSQRTLRKPRALTLRRNRSNLARKRRIASTKTSTKPVPTRPVRKASNSEKVPSQSKLSSSKQVSTAPEVPELPPGPEGQTATFIYGGEMRVNSISISVHAFNDEYLKTTSKELVLLPHAQPESVLSDQLLAASNTTAADRKKRTLFVDGSWRGSVRERKWGPLCPSVVVKRSREAVAKTLLLQCKAARARKKARRPPPPAVVVTQATPKPAKRAKKHSRSSDTKSRPLHPPAPLTSVLPRRSLSIPDDIPIGPSDMSINDDDINWQELSDFLESNDEESMSSLPPPLGGYGPPPQQHPPPHMEPVHFDDGFGPRQLMHPPFMPPPHHPGHLHLPPPPHPLGPPPGPHTPVMPFPPDMRPPVADGYFSPMMGGPEDFLPGSAGLGPDGGGYSSPMTPHRVYPPNPMCPMDYQHSPGHHHHHHMSQFPMPSPRMNFPPPGRAFPIPPLPRPKQRRGGGGGGNHGGGPGSRSNNGTMSKMVGKMRLKSPGASPQQRKKLLPPTDGTSSPAPTEQQGKKRRSPGYSDAGWRCRCGTNNVMFPDKVCAKGKCPCYTKGVACKNCLCRHCHNPFGCRELGANLPTDASSISKQLSESHSTECAVE